MTLILGVASLLLEEKKKKVHQHQNPIPIVKYGGPVDAKHGGEFKEIVKKNTKFYIHY